MTAHKTLMIPVMTVQSYLKGPKIYSLEFRFMCKDKRFKEVKIEAHYP